MGNSVQDLGESEVGEAYDTSIAPTPPSQPCGQFQAQRSDNNSRDSIAYCRTDTPSQREIFSGATHNNTFRTATPSQSEIFSQTTHNNRFRTNTFSQSEIFSQTTHNNRLRTNTSSQSEIFSETSNASYSSYTETGMSTDIREEFTTPSQTSSEVTSSAYSSETSRTTTSSQSEIFTETATEYDASSEASSRETSRPSSPESGNLTVRSVYSPLPEMAIVHKTMHDAIHAVRDQQGRAVTRRSLQQQQEIAASKLKCMSQIGKTSTPDPPPPKSNSFPRRARAGSEMANGTTSGSSEESDCENPKKAKFLALKRRFESTHLQHHPMRRRLNVLNYFLPGPAHPPKSDNVAKRPPAIIETDQDPPKTSNGNPLKVDRRDQQLHCI